MASAMILTVLLAAAISSVSAAGPRTFVSTEAQLIAAVALTHDEAGYIFLVNDITLTKTLYINDAHFIGSNGWQGGQFMSIYTNKVPNDYAIVVSLNPSITTPMYFKFIIIDGMAASRTYPSVLIDRGTMQFLSSGIVDSHDDSAKSQGGGIEISGETSTATIVNFFPTKLSKLNTTYPSFLTGNTAYAGGAASITGPKATLNFCYGRTYSNVASVGKAYKDFVVGDGATLNEAYGDISSIYPDDTISVAGVTTGNYASTNIYPTGSATNDTTTAGVTISGVAATATITQVKSPAMANSPSKTCKKWVKTVATNLAATTKQ